MWQFSQRREQHRCLPQSVRRRKPAHLTSWRITQILFPPIRREGQPIFKLNKALIDEYENIGTIDYQKVLSWVRNKIETHIQEYICIMSNEKKVGYFYFHRKNEEMEINDLYIFLQYQGMGIGTEILKKCISETKLPIFLYVFVNNKRAVALYQKLGFQVTEIIKGTRYIMQRIKQIT
jgi:ribosomal protein S18 acetylase RimI-like enzyme